MKQSKTSMIKGKAYNQVQRYFQSSQKYNKDTKKWETLDPLANLSDKEKMEAITIIMNEAVAEMRNYKSKKRQKKIITKLREERGYKGKKKTSKTEWLQQQNKQTA